MICEEQARAELKEYAESLGIELPGAQEAPQDDFEQAEIRDHQRAVDALVKGMCKGYIKLTEDGKLVFTPTRSKESPEEIVFSEPNGRFLLKLGGSKGDTEMHRAFRGLAELTGKPPAHFSKLGLRDASVCMSIFAFFMMASL